MELHELQLFEFNSIVGDDRLLIGTLCQRFIRVNKNGFPDSNQIWEIGGDMLEILEIDDAVQCWDIYVNNGCVEYTCYRYNDRLFGVCEIVAHVVPKRSEQSE